MSHRTYDEEGNLWEHYNIGGVKTSLLVEPAPATTLSIQFNKDEAKQLLAGITQLMVVIERGTPRWDQVTALGDRLLRFLSEVE